MATTKKKYNRTLTGESNLFTLRPTYENEEHWWALKKWCLDNNMALSVMFNAMIEPLKIAVLQTAEQVTPNVITIEVNVGKIYLRTKTPNETR